MKHEIDIPELQEGWEPVEFRCPKDGESYVGYDGKVIISLSTNFHGPRLIVKKKQPRRIVLEETGEVRNAMPGEYAQQVESNGVFIWDSQNPSISRYKIWREVKETDLSLHNSDDKESLRLTREQCRELLNFSSSAIEMIRDFLRSKQ